VKPIDLVWFTAVVEDGQVFSFALNIDMPDRITVAKQMELGKASLKALDIF